MEIRTSIDKINVFFFSIGPPISCNFTVHSVMEGTFREVAQKPEVFLGERATIEKITAEGISQDLREIISRSPLEPILRGPTRPLEIIGCYLVLCLISWHSRDPQKYPYPTEGQISSNLIIKLPPDLVELNSNTKELEKLQEAIVKGWNAGCRFLAPPQK